MTSSTAVRPVIPPGSVEYVYAAVKANEDPTGAVVSFGFSADKDTAPTTWTVGEWLPGTSPQFIADRWVMANVAQVLASATDEGGDVELDPGTYAVWVNFGFTPQLPVRHVGWVEVQ